MDMNYYLNPKYRKVAFGLTQSVIPSMSYYMYLNESSVKVLEGSYIVKITIMAMLAIVK